MNKENLDNVIDNFHIVRNSENSLDTIHLLQPLISGEVEYALPSDISVEERRIVHCFFESFKNKVFDNKKFMSLIQAVDLDAFIKEKKQYKYDDYINITIQTVLGIGKDLGMITNTEGNNTGRITAIMTLSRLTATFQSAVILSRHGMFMETNFIIRVLIEQMAYAYKCLTLTNDEEIENLQPNACISELKKKFPLIGKLNGIFSNYIHLKLNTFHDFVIDGEENVLHILTRSGKKAKENYLLIMYLAEIYLVICSDIINTSNKELSDLDKMKYTYSIQIVNRIKERYIKDFQLTTAST